MSVIVSERLRNNLSGGRGAREVEGTSYTFTSKEYYGQSFVS